MTLLCKLRVERCPLQNIICVEEYLFIFISGEVLIFLVLLLKAVDTTRFEYYFTYNCRSGKKTNILEKFYARFWRYFHLFLGPHTNDFRIVVTVIIIVTRRDFLAIVLARPDGRVHRCQPLIYYCRFLRAGQRNGGNGKPAMAREIDHVYAVRVQRNRPLPEVHRALTVAIDVVG